MCYVSGVYHYSLYCEFASEQHWKCDLVSIIFFSHIFLSYFSLILCVSWTSECVLRCNAVEYAFWALAVL